jgi:hypothetical protein
VTEETDVLERVAELAREAERINAELEVAMVEASAAGASVRDLAAAMRTSKSSVSRRLSGESRSASNGDDESAELQREILEAKRTYAKLKVAREASNVRWQTDEAARIREANDLTRITEADLAWPTLADE